MNGFAKDSGAPELRARDIFFRPVDIRSTEIIEVARDRRTGLFLFTTTALLVAADAFQFGTGITLLESCALWACTVAAQVVLFVLLTICWAWGQTKMGLFVAVLPVFNLVAFLPVLHLNGMLLSRLSGVPSATALWSGTALGGVVVALSVEAIFFAFVFPLIRIRPGNAAGPALAAARDHLAGEASGQDAEAPGRVIRAAGLDFALDDLVLLRSQGHYVEVVTRDGTRRIRARLGDLVSQTRPGDGIQAHRSYWLARSAITGLVTEDRGAYLALADGSEFAVAGPRRDAVANWVAEFAPEGGRGGRS